MEKASAKRGRAPCGAGFVRSGRPFSSLPAAGLLLACAVGLLAVAGTVPAAADPVYEGPVLYGLDPVIRATDDPRLLGVERLVLLRRLQGFGVDPYLQPDRRPGLESSFRQYWQSRSNVDLVRKERLLEYNGAMGVMTTIEYPSFFFLFPTPETLPGGFVYYPPRPVGDPVVKLFVDEVKPGAMRRHAVDQASLRVTELDISGKGRRTDQNDGLINLTIPIKLPRTLEKIIGRGEKTKIKITGRERIAISGESKVIKPFTPNERVSSQSLFPTLDMEQELQINLSGTIGEKIIIEVDHNSAAIGPDGTKIKLMYQGTEDEIIKTIETGDVGLTLPGSQLLGYSSNKSGLFGIKVTGQLGRADFTVVASKQKAESSSKTFNATGGEVSDNVILSSQYLNNRFFRLDLPADEINGRRGDERIDFASVKIYRLMPAGALTGQDIANVAVYADTTGYRDWTTLDFNAPFEYGQRWREITSFDPLLDSNGGLVAVDMRSALNDDDVLAVIYDVVAGPTSNPVFVASVGDNPGTTNATQDVPGAPGTFYRMKLLKTPTNRTQDHVFRYILRNIYSLGGSNIDETTFQLKIERIQAGLSNLDQDEKGLEYIRIFGLDQKDAQGGDRPDGTVDWNDPLLFDLNKGLLKFPLDFPTPFNGTEQQYRDYADTVAFDWEGTFLADNLAPDLYDPDVLTTEYSKSAYFRIISTHAAAASSFNLGVSNIEDGSEVVTVDGRTLTRGVDYEIDYTFGELRLLGEAANLSADSKVAVNYQYAPFFGGGNTSLTGFNLGYDLGRDSKLGTTWLYQTEAIVGEKAKLGEEPSKNLVGNLNLQHTFRPYFLTHVANFVSRRNTERESTLQFNGETAISLPNPNTKGKVFLEDFEGVDSSDVVTLSRIGWSWGSAPFLSEAEIAANNDTRQFDPEDRVETVRWYLPKDRVLRRYLNPDLVNQERDETQQAMEVYLRADDGAWGAEDWGGIMRGISRTGLDLSKSQFVEIWINDGTPDIDQRRGKLHIDFGYISEDGFWPVDDSDQLVVGEWEREDGILPGQNPDGVWVFDEDIGLDGNEFGPQRFSAEESIDGDSPFPGINGTARNNREDDEDLNGNTRLDQDNGYFTTTIDLKETPALVDVVYDYDDVQDLKDGNISWRKYRIPIGALEQVSSGTVANLKAVTHTRIWFEDDAPGVARPNVRLQLSEFRFLGSRWEREGVRRTDTEALLTEAELLPGEEFFLGEVNNKENPGYYPPFAVEEINNIPTKEQSLVLNFQNIEQGHMVRASKQVSPRGDDYTGYRDISWWWFNPSHTTADLDLYFRVGSDTLNYYEVDYSFNTSPAKTGWHQVVLGIAELSNAKNGEIGVDGKVRSTVFDRRSGEAYDVTVVGRPDLRAVKRYYFGIKNKVLSQAATGYIYLNDVLLEGVKRDVGLAQRAGVRLNMADVIKLDFDWNRTDAEYHGLNARTGSGINSEDWNAALSFNVDDFIPLAGFRLPLSGSRRQTIKRPKYELNSDIEIIDEDTRNAYSTVETAERFSSRLSHSPSKAAIPRYLVDPWSILLSGSRGDLAGPTEQRANKSLQGSLNYDLRIPGIYRLSNYPLFKYIPIVRSLSIVPKKFAFGANFSSTKNSSVAISEDGVVTPRPAQVSRPGKLTGSVDYQPLQIVDMSIGANSDRDLLRKQLWNGVNIGEENGRSYNLRMTFLVPRAREMPQTKILAPVRTVFKGLSKMRPSIQYNGAFNDVHDPGIRQPGDPEDIRSVSNSGRWEFRLDVPVGEAFTAIFPKNRFSAGQRDRMIAEQRRREQQEQRTGGRGAQSPDQVPGQTPGQAPGQTGTDPGTPTPGTVPELDEELTPEEIQRREGERLLREAEAQLERDLEQGLVAEEETTTAAEGDGINPLKIFDPLLDTLRNTTPVKVTYTDNRNSAYARIQDKASFWYKTGLVNELSTADSLYASSSFDKRQSLSLSTTSKMTNNIALDVKFGKDTSLREQIGSEVRSFKQDWPEAQVSLSGIERWGVFGGDKDDREAGWFQNSSFNISYKRSKTVNNITANSYNPSISTSMTPRWTMTFHSGLTATVNATLANDESLANGITTKNNRTRMGLQLRHQFNAQTFLAKLGLYRPGSSQSLNMDVDVSYEKDRSQRANRGVQVSAPTGQNRYNINPRFTYQITRNLSGSVRFIFSRTKNVATNQTTTTFGLGVEATFVF